MLGGSYGAGAGGGAGGQIVAAGGGPEPSVLEGLPGLPGALALVEAALSLGQHLPQMLLYRRARGAAASGGRYGRAWARGKGAAFLSAELRLQPGGPGGRASRGQMW
jgi:hypothetical protein